MAVKAVFEKFSERSIKAVMIAQQEAKALGASEVRMCGDCWVWSTAWALS